MQSIINLLSNDSTVINIGFVVAFFISIAGLIFVARRVAQIKTLLATGEKHYWEARRALDADDQAAMAAAYGRMLEVYRQAAALGSSEAKTRLGHTYREGWGVPSDLHAAFTWYEKAAKRGMHEAQYHLSQCYENGLGCAIDPRKAKHWQRRCKNARFRIGF